MDSDLISPEDTIFSIVTKFPKLRKTLTDISPRFEKLNNPLLFNTVAKLTTVAKASKMGNVYLNEMLYQLNEAIGKGEVYLENVKTRNAANQGKFLKERFGESAVKPKPAWVAGAAGFETLDVRESGGEPFFEVTKRTAALTPGSGLVLVQKFEPLPLIQHHEQQGFETYTDRISDDEYWVYFFKPRAENRKEQ